jgi:hypothetical protein
MALMRISPDWDCFMLNFDRDFRPHILEQKDMLAETEAEEGREAAK